MAYPFAPGPSLRAEHLSPAVLDRLAEYCAFRAREFKLQEAQSFQQLEDMLRFNLIEEFGGGEQAAELWDTTRDREYVFPEIAPGTLATVNPVLVDGRMQPHEWLLQDGTMIKSDGSSHGDDHFFPGPTDIAWDLAGAMVEWEMDSHAAEFFLARYALWSGDDPRPRLPGFLLAYTVFRMGYCKMAFEAEAGSGEQSRLHHAYEHYRNRAQRLASFPFELRKMAATVAKGTPQVQSQ